jgi:hypothetical protein
VVVGSFGGERFQFGWWLYRWKRILLLVRRTSSLFGIGIDTTTFAGRMIHAVLILLLWGMYSKINCFISQPT